MMQKNWKRNVLAISAVTAALALTGCGQAGEDSAAVSRSNTAPASTATAPADRMTADASKAMDRAGSTTSGAANSTATTAGTAANKMATGAGNAASSAGSAAGDAALTAKVKSKLMAEPGIESLKIDVDTESSKVILKGEVDTAANRDKAKQIARSTEGVTEVVDQMRVAQPK